MVVSSDHNPTPIYRFVFFRDMVNDLGDHFRCQVSTVRITHARSPERALAAALRRFERQHRLSNWRDLAHGYEFHEGESHTPERPC